MFTYYLDLARRSLRRNPALTILMIVAIAFGVGASMTTLTVLHVLSADPIPQKSQQLFYVQVDPVRAASYTPGEEPPRQLTRRDGEQLLRAARGDRQALMTGGGAAIEPERQASGAVIEPFLVDARWTSSELFAMFEVPFVSGTGWSAADDDSGARVAVITRKLADKVFGTADAVGKSLRVQGNELRITGVIEDWRPAPHFYDLNTGSYSQAEQLFAPYRTAIDLKLPRQGSMDCWAEHSDSNALDAPCVWLQFWVELDSADKAAAYREFLVRYSEEQKAAGRFERAPNVRLRNVTEWLVYNKVVPDDVRLQTWIALGFLLVCLVNTVGLLLTKFLRRSAEVGVRRALGASKRSIFIQLLVEAGVVGLAGGALGLVLAWLGLLAVRQQPTEHADLAHLDLPMLAATFGLAIATSLLAGILPAWRGCQLTPALQLKSQ